MGSFSVIVMELEALSFCLLTPFSQPPFPVFKEAVSEQGLAEDWHSGSSVLLLVQVLGQIVALQGLFCFSLHWGPAEFGGRTTKSPRGQDRTLGSLLESARAPAKSRCSDLPQYIFKCFILGSLIWGFSPGVFLGRAGFIFLFFFFALFSAPSVLRFPFTFWHCTNTSFRTVSILSKLSNPRHWNSTYSSSWHDFGSGQRALSFGSCPPCQRAPQAQWLVTDIAEDPVL